MGVRVEISSINMMITDRDIEYLKHIESFYDTQIMEMPANIGELLS